MFIQLLADGNNGRSRLCYSVAFVVCCL